MQIYMKCEYMCAVFFTTSQSSEQYDEQSQIIIHSVKVEWHECSECIGTQLTFVVRYVTICNYNSQWMKNE